MTLYYSIGDMCTMSIDPDI